MELYDSSAGAEGVVIAKIEGQILEGIAKRRVRRRRAKIAAMVSAGAVVGASLTGGAFALFAGQEEQVYSAYCYSQPSTDSVYTQAVISNAVDRVTGEQGTREPADALDLCAAMWSSGVIGQDRSPDNPNAHLYPVPTLQACVRSDGVRAVFPSDDTSICEKLGLEDPR